MGMRGTPQAVPGWLSARERPIPIQATAITAGEIFESSLLCLSDTAAVSLGVVMIRSQLNSGVRLMPRHLGGAMDQSAKTALALRLAGALDLLIALFLVTTP